MILSLSKIRLSYLDGVDTRMYDFIQLRGHTDTHYKKLALLNPPCYGSRAYRDFNLTPFH